MQCSHCRLERCSSEFPTLLSKACDHAPGLCLTCVDQLLLLTKGGGYQGDAAKCPECQVPVTNEDQERLKAGLKSRDRECSAFKDLDALKSREAKAKEDATAMSLGLDDGPQEGFIEVSVLDGRRCKLQLSRRSRLSEVKEMVRQKLDVPTGKQRLLFRGRDLGGKDESNPSWGSLGVPFGEVVQLVIIMYETASGSSGQRVRRMKFDLSWAAHPVRLRTGKITTHHLNGSCIILDSRGSMIESVDFQKRNYPGIEHGGPSSIRSPKQSITVNTAMLSSQCHYLFFTLSAFAPGGVTLSKFEDLTVRLRDSDSLSSLATYTARQARDGEAVVLCCAKRDQTSDEWRVQVVGSESSGNTKNYAPLLTAVQRVVRSGHVL
eukprot:TRINITY_DN22787_c0_g1_i1.p1 TRINITY_DN22787_c0_g1~~TRINITY_DN22787_c0_g1_i1.p1  ORF type:complete len:378 (-),score=75.24 TRINITY_DN22787_c0_g1_i1:511-1644(-)